MCIYMLINTILNKILYNMLCPPAANEASSEAARFQHQPAATHRTHPRVEHAGACRCCGRSVSSICCRLLLLLLWENEVLQFLF
jgi:hypothetical protein